MKTVQPAQNIVTCDGCQRKIHPHGPAWHKQNGGITLRRDALDYQGSPCANAGMSFDFCDDCLPQVVQSINDSIERIRAALEKL